MKIKTITLHNPATFPSQVATRVVKSGVRGRWQEAVLAISVGVGTGDPRGLSPKSKQGLPRITLTDIATGRQTAVNLHWKKETP